MNGMNKDEIFNHAIELSLEWGENFMKPINERLRAQYPHLSDEEAGHYDALCGGLKNYAFSQIEQAYTKQISWPQAKQNVDEKYPGLSDENWQRLCTQGQYYAWRDHG